MQKNGIVAVGDICNTTDTIETKRRVKSIIIPLSKQWGSKTEPMK